MWIRIIYRIVELHLKKHANDEENSIDKVRAHQTRREERNKIKEYDKNTKHVFQSR